jgi:hypothetical protein
LAVSVDALGAESSWVITDWSIQGRAVDGGSGAGTKTGGSHISGILASLEHPLTSAQFEVCNFANASSTKVAMLSIATLYSLAGVSS